MKHIKIENEWPATLVECEIEECELVATIQTMNTQIELYEAGEYVSDKPNWRSAVGFARNHRYAELRDLRSHMKDLQRQEKEARRSELHRIRADMQSAKCGALLRFIRERMGEEVMPEVYDMCRSVEEAHA